MCVALMTFARRKISRARPNQGAVRTRSSPDVGLSMKCSKQVAQVTVARLPLVFFAFSAVAIAPQQPSPPSNQTAPAQPIPYSHKTHVALGLKCAACHPNPQPKNKMTIPSGEICMACHQAIAKDRPSIRRLAELAESKVSIPWIRVYKLPDEIIWSHGIHLRVKLKCETCHGDVSKMDVMTRATNVTTMAACVDCHQESDASTDCNACHQQ